MPRRRLVNKYKMYVQPLYLENFTHWRRRHKNVCFPMEPPTFSCRGSESLTSIFGSVNTCIISNLNFSSNTKKTSMSNRSGRQFMSQPNDSAGSPGESALQEGLPQSTATANPKGDGDWRPHRQNLAALVLAWGFLPLKAKYQLGLSDRAGEVRTTHAVAARSPLKRSL